MDPVGYNGLRCVWLDVVAVRWIQMDLIGPSGPTWPPLDGGIAGSTALTVSLNSPTPNHSQSVPTMVA